jgi:UDP-N-acetylmuramyl pentapeptide phosphotransferase/UDP-N-acetylglucosamine-1-phosphate transferase
MSGLSTFEILAALIFAAVLSADTAARFAMRHGMVDIPGDRQSHTTPTPTGGGIGIIAALLVTSLVFIADGLVPVGWSLAVLPGMVLLSLVGWLDDRKPLPTLFRLIIQLAVSFGLLAFLVFKGQLDHWPLTLLGGLVIVWIMNFYNFMDGSHGMAGFQGLFCGALLGAIFTLQGQAQLALPAFLLAGCCLGFLPMNFPSPRVFMGDAGSVPLGFVIAGLLVLGLVQNVLSLPVSMLVLSVFLVDSSLTLLNRVIRREQWYTAHKQHMYQRLIAQGWPHSRVLVLYQAINITLVAPVSILALMYPEYAWQLTAITYLLLISGWYSASLRLGVRK